MTQEERARLAALAAMDERSDEEETEFRGLVAKASAEPEPEKPEGERSVGELSPDELVRTIGTAVGAAVSEAVKPLTETNRTATPYGEAARTEPSWADKRRYARLEATDPSMAGLRSPETDLHIREWILAKQVGDRQRLHELVQANPEYYSESMGMQRALATTSATAAGSLVPDPLANVIVATLENIAVIGPRAQPFSNDAGRVTIDTEGVKVAVAAKDENIDSGETDPTFPPVPLKTVTATGIVRSSRENESDSAFDMTSIFSRQAGEAYAEFNDSQDLVGPDNSFPLIAGITTHVVSTVGTLTEGLFTQLFYLPKGAYRARGFWLMSSTNMQRASDLSFGTGRQVLIPGGDPLGALAGGQGGGQQGTILGQPVLEPAGGMTDTDIIFGALGSGFAQLTKGGMLAETTMSGGDAFVKHQMLWKFVQRRDSGLTKEIAFSKGEGITG